MGIVLNLYQLLNETDDRNDSESGSDINTSDCEYSDDEWDPGEVSNVAITETRSDSSYIVIPLKFNSNLNL